MHKLACKAALDKLKEAQQDTHLTSLNQPSNNSSPNEAVNIETNDIESDHETSLYVINEVGECTTVDESSVSESCSGLKEDG